MSHDDNQTMDMDLAALYGTPGGPPQEDLEKQAQAELFCKLAAENGIDLDKLNDDQINELWSEVMGKEASDDSDEKKDDKDDEGDDKKDEKKEAAAAAEFEALQERSKEAAAQLEFADKMGRTMAHSMVQELGRIGDAMEKGASAGQAAKNIGQLAAYAGKKGGRAAGEGAQSAAERLGAAARHHIGGRSKTLVDANKAKSRRVGYGIMGGTAAAGAGGAAAAKGGKKKESSAIDELAFEAAVVKAAEAGWDLDEAAERVAAIQTLGLDESEKIASAQTTEQAVDIRALEILEKAGYSVTWEE